MANYKILTGPFEGEVVEEGQILDVPFSSLDEDMQSRIKEWAQGKDQFYSPASLDEMKQDFENSWESEETEEEVTLMPYSEH